MKKYEEPIVEVLKFCVLDPTNLEGGASTPEFPMNIAEEDALA